MGGGRYSIGTTARLTGLSADTLRAWERRHAAITPEHTVRGRLYSDDDLARLRLLRAVIERGHTIGAVATRSNDVLQRLAAAPRRPAAGGRVPERVSLNALAEAIARYDHDRLARQLSRLSFALSPRDFVFDAVLPLLARVGDDWTAGRLRPAQEHLLSASMRDALGTLLRSVARETPPRFVFATPPGERHEFGILSAAVLAASRGFGVLYLGPDLPPEDLAHAARRVHPHAVVVALTMSGAPEADLQSLRKHLPTVVELWAGGAALGRSAASGRRILPLYDMQAFEQQLARVPKHV